MAENVGDGGSFEDVLARLEWFARTGDARQWSGPAEINPLPGMQRDLRAWLNALASREASLGNLGVGEGDRA